uniref:Uncharacterized protein n=1 Tax=Globodera rostochiensis TaxID=31243 RepID=A0A914GTC1_GLORO
MDKDNKLKRINAFNAAVAAYVRSAAGQSALAGLARATIRFEERRARYGQFPAGAADASGPPRGPVWPPVKAFSAAELIPFHNNAAFLHRVAANWRQTILEGHRNDAIGQAAYQAAFHGEYVPLTDAEYRAAMGMPRHAAPVLVDRHLPVLPVDGGAVQPAEHHAPASSLAQPSVIPAATATRRRHPNETIGTLGPSAPQRRRALSTDQQFERIKEGLIDIVARIAHLQSQHHNQPSTSQDRRRSKSPDFLFHRTPSPPFHLAAPHLQAWVPTQQEVQEGLAVANLFEEGMATANIESTGGHLPAAVSVDNVRQVQQAVIGSGNLRGLLGPPDPSRALRDRSLNRHVVVQRRAPSLQPLVAYVATDTIRAFWRLAGASGTADITEQQQQFATVTGSTGTADTTERQRQQFAKKF